jgi:N-dimethylarginine dimethylaminohydrolase
MKIQLELKAQKKREEEDLKKRENEQYAAYMKELDNRGEAVKKVKEEKEKAKDQIFQKLKEEEDRRRR